MVDNSNQVLSEIRNIIATGNGIDEQTYRRLSLAIQADTSERLTAVEMALASKADLNHTHPDIEALKKRDWYSLTVAVVVALATSAMAWLKK